MSCSIEDTNSQFKRANLEQAILLNVKLHSIVGVSNQEAPVERHSEVTPVLDLLLLQERDFSALTASYSDYSPRCLVTNAACGGPNLPEQRFKSTILKLHSTLRLESSEMCWEIDRCNLD
jgi:hypothetical protein